MLDDLEGETPSSLSDNEDDCRPAPMMPHPIPSRIVARKSKLEYVLQARRCNCDRKVATELEEVVCNVEHLFPTHQ